VEQVRAEFISWLQTEGTPEPDTEAIEKEVYERMRDIREE
jgi:hypothetical protein